MDSGRLRSRAFAIGALLVLMVGCTQSSDARLSLGPSAKATHAVNVSGVMVLTVEKGGEPIRRSAPRALPGKVHVLGPFSAVEADAYDGYVCCSAKEISLVTRVATDPHGRFSIGLAPGRYVLVGHPNQEKRYTYDQLYQRRTVIVPRRGVVTVRLLLVEYLP